MSDASDYLSAQLREKLSPYARDRYFPSTDDKDVHGELWRDFNEWLGPYLEENPPARDANGILIGGSQDWGTASHFDTFLSDRYPSQETLDTRNQESGAGLGGYDFLEGTDPNAPPPNIIDELFSDAPPGGVVSGEDLQDFTGVGDLPTPPSQGAASSDGSLPAYSFVEALRSPQLPLARQAPPPTSAAPIGGVGLANLNRLFSQQNAAQGNPAGMTEVSKALRGGTPSGQI